MHRTAERSAEPLAPCHRQAIAEQDGAGIEKTERPVLNDLEAILFKPSAPCARREGPQLADTLGRRSMTCWNQAAGDDPRVALDRILSRLTWRRRDHVLR